MRALGRRLVVALGPVLAVNLDKIAANAAGDATAFVVNRCAKRPIFCTTATIGATQPMLAGG